MHGFHIVLVAHIVVAEKKLNDIYTNLNYHRINIMDINLT